MASKTIDNKTYTDMENKKPSIAKNFVNKNNGDIGFDITILSAKRASPKYQSFL